MDLRTKRYFKFSILIILVYSLGFISYSLFIDSQWRCPVCSYSGQSITPIVNEQYPMILLTEINSAKESIDIIMYEMKFYETNNSVRQLEDALIAANNRGAKVRIILDQGEWHKEITSLTKENWKTAKYFADNGLNVKFDSLKETTHTKLVIIDNQKIIIGSTNWGFSAFERNNEANVMLEDSKAVEYYDKYFELLWNPSDYYQPK